jgi:hypothetical protein
MQPLNAVPRHTAISISAKIRFIRASLVSSEANIFGAQITGVFVCNETCGLKQLAGTGLLANPAGAQGAGRTGNAGNGAAVRAPVGRSPAAVGAADAGASHTAGSCNLAVVRRGMKRRVDSLEPLSGLVRPAGIEPATPAFGVLPAHRNSL